METKRPTNKPKYKKRMQIPETSKKKNTYNNKNKITPLKRIQS